MLGGAAVNQTLAGLAGSLASLYGAALAQPALALGAVPSLIPDAVTSLWSLLGNALREAAKPPPIVCLGRCAMCPSVWKLCARHCSLPSFHAVTVLPSA